ncbi:MAG: anthranilate synthase component I [Gammaproteobacteria bacterium]|nr:anthranilate synthase component I [Gammaproteobacteria bacterium]
MTLRAQLRRVPLVREQLADLDTPFGAYLKLAAEPYSYIFESMQGGERWGRYSFIGLAAARVLRVSGHEVTVTDGGVVVEREQVTDPLAFIEQFAARYDVTLPPGLPRFAGGLVGYFGYDIVRYIEPKLAATVKRDELGCPDILLMVSDEVVIFDNLLGRAYIVVYVDPDDPTARTRGTQRLDEIATRLAAPLPVELAQPQPAAPLTSEQVRVGFERPAYEAMVEHVKQYIRDGDCMQVVPSQRMSAPYRGDPAVLYRALRSLNPSPYLFCLNLGDFHIVGSSPEILVRLEDGEVTVRPIAGTRPRGRTVAEDEALAQELLADDKELAEHLMLIDLGRNDISRVCTAGSVELSERMVIERYSHVMHIVSNVHGRLAPGKTALDVLRATFPAGTLSGAPKVRAMEIIDEVEPVKRGIYGGAVGYLSWSGNIDMAIAIRMAVIKDGMLHVQAGGGIVADSVPANEWDETINKGKAVMRALDLALAGLVLAKR